MVVGTLKKFLSLLMTPRENEKSATSRILAKIFKVPSNPNCSMVL